MSGADEREELRRRLYRREASGSDVEAFASMDPGSGGARERYRRPGRRSIVAAALGAAVVATFAAVALGRRGGSESPKPRMEVVEPVPVVVDRDTQDAFIARLTDGRSAGLADWLAAHGGLVPGGVGIATRTRTVERSGTGRGLIGLEGAEQRATDLRITVVVVLDITARTRWSVLAPEGTVQEQAGSLPAGVPGVGASVFDAAQRPVRLRIDVPDGVRWGLAAVFSS